MTIKQKKGNNNKTTKTATLVILLATSYILGYNSVATTNPELLKASVTQNAQQLQTNGVQITSSDLGYCCILGSGASNMQCGRICLNTPILATLQSNQGNQNFNAAIQSAFTQLNGTISTRLQTEVQSGIATLQMAYADPVQPNHYSLFTSFRNQLNSAIQTSANEGVQELITNLTPRNIQGLQQGINQFGNTIISDLENILAEKVMEAIELASSGANIQDVISGLSGIIGDLEDALDDLVDAEQQIWIN
jgi:hypothetical protein